MKLGSASALSCALLCCSSEPPEAGQLGLTAGPLLVCDYDPTSTREAVDICHDTANAVGGAASTPGPHRHIRTSERGCIHGHAGHHFDFSLPPGAKVPDPLNPCACAPEGTTFAPGAVACCPCLSLEVLSETVARCVAPSGSLVCPPDVEVGCGELEVSDPAALAKTFGAASSTNACDSIVEELPTVALDTCGAGEIVRRFRALGPGGQDRGGCSQRITVASRDGYSVRFPGDARVDLGEDPEPADPDQVLVSSEACARVATRYTEVRFPAAPEACRMIERTWDLADFCEWDGMAEPLVVGRDEDGDGVPGDEAVWLSVADGLARIDDDGESSNGALREVGERSGSWRYTQRIALDDLAGPGITLAPYDKFCDLSPGCAGSFAIGVSITDRGTPNEINLDVALDLHDDGTDDHRVTRLAGSAPSGDTQALILSGALSALTIRSPSEAIPYGSHRLHLVAEDGCGNVSKVSAPFIVSDCKAPTVVCLNGLAVNLQPPSGATTLSAADFLQYGDDNCSTTLDYAIRRSSGGSGFPTDGAGTPIAELTFSPADLGTQYVELWGRDAAGNADFCETYVLLQDPSGMFE